MNNHSSDFTDILADCESRGLRIALAESLTGGALSAKIVDVPGASRVLLGGVVAYSNAMKRELLGVSSETLNLHGAVSAQTAGEMATGARLKMAGAAGLSADDVIGISTTGVAGPDTDGEHQVGEVFIAIEWPGKGLEVAHLRLAGDRAVVRSGTVAAVADLLRSLLAK
ncbi:MAG: CinA family protein [Micrococcales bacterium]